MANQWGRESQGRTSGGSGPAGIAIAALVCFLLGAGGGYGYFIWTRSDLKAQIDLLSSRIVETSAERDKLASDIATYRKDSGSWAQDLETELAAIRKKLAQAEVSGQASQDEASKLRAEIDRINAEDIPEIRKDAVASVDAVRQEADDAQAALGKQLQEAEAKSAELEKRLGQALADGDDTALAAELQQKLQAEAARAAGLQKTIDALTADVAALKLAATVRQVEESGDQPAEPQISAKPVRDRTAVEQALTGTVGLQGLAQADRQVLRDRLVAGECVVPSLDLVFDRVPILVLRNLMRDLKSDC